MNVLVLGDGLLARRIKMFLNNMNVLTEWYDKATYCISAQHPDILNQDYIDHFDYVLNIHFSDTSIMRGCNMMTHAIASGADKTAVTFHRIVDEGIDSGPIVAKVDVPIFGNDTAKTLYDRCTEMAYARFVDLWDVLKRKPEGIPQEELGRYFNRSELNNTIVFGEEEDRKLRSVIFDDERGPMLVIGGRRYGLVEK